MVLRLALALRAAGPDLIDSPEPRILFNLLKVSRGGIVAEYGLVFCCFSQYLGDRIIFNSSESSIFYNGIVEYKALPNVIKQCQTKDF